MSLTHNQGLVINANTGTAAFAYNADRGDPYHRLGVPVNGYGTIDEMLHAAAADYLVEQLPLQIVGPNGTVVPVHSHVANTRMGNYYDPSVGRWVMARECLGVVGTDYVVEQNRDAAEFAYACVGAASTDAIIDTMGVMRGGAEFFVYVRLEPLTLTGPSGVPDEMEMGLAVRTSHDGSTSLCAYPTAIRLVCSNSVSASIKEASNIVRIRHTLNKDLRKHQAVLALGVAAAVREDFTRTANLLMGMPATWRTVEQCAERVWPMDPANVSKRGATIHDVRLEVLRSLWLSPNNSGGFGENRWTVLQTIGEYLDHCRGLDEHRRAVASMNPSGLVAQRKAKALGFLLQV